MTFGKFSHISWLIGVILSICGPVGVFGASPSSPIIEKFMNPAEASSRWKLTTNGDGQWKIANGVLAQTGLNTASTASIGDETWTNYSVDFRIRRLEYNSKQNNHYGIKVRSGKDGNIYIHNNGKFMAYAVTGRSGSILPESSPIGQWLSFHVVCQGQTIRCSVDGKEILHLTEMPQRAGGIEFFAYNTRMEVTDVFITPIASPAEPATKKINFILNSDFASDTDGIPNYWGFGHWGLQSIHMGGKTPQEYRRDWARVDATFIKGAYSMKLAGTTLSTNTLIVPEVQKKYTFSAYMKSDQPSHPVTITIKQFTAPYITHKFDVNSEWKRYSFTFELGSNENMILIEPAIDGTVWVNAVQLELGEKASAYQPNMSTVENPQSNVPLDVPVQKCPKLKDTPVLDGKLEDACWKQAQKEQLVLLDGKQPTQPTEAWVFHDEDNLYLAFKCHDSKMKDLITNEVGRDVPVWRDDAIEFFINPNPEKSVYYHFGVSASGAIYDSQEVDTTWDGDWTAVVDKAKDHWIVEIKLPFSSMGITHLSNPAWRINLCRENHRFSEYSCMSPTFGPFHTLPRWAVLQGIDKSVFAKYSCQLTNVQLENAGSESYDVACEIDNNASEDREIEVRVDLKTNEKTPQSKTAKFSVKPGKANRIVLGSYRINNVERCYADVRINDTKTSQPIVFARKEIAVPSVLDSFLQYSYYTNEKNADMYCQINASQASLTKMKLVSTIQNAKLPPVSLNGPLAKMNVVSFDISQLPVGRYEVVTQLLNETNHVVDSTTLPLVKLAHKDYAVKLDRVSRMLSVAGKPFFPVNIFWEQLPNEIVQDAEAKSGFNSSVVTFMIDDAPEKEKQQEQNIQAVLDGAQKRNIRVVFWLMHPDTMINFKEGSVERVEKWVGKFKDHPAVLAWCIADEPFSGGAAAAVRIKQAIQIVRDFDPYRPVFFDNCCYGLSNRFADLEGDFVAIYSYIIPVSMEEVGMWIERVESAAAPGRKLSFLVHLTGGNAYSRDRSPTAMEQEAQTYLSLITGTRAISYFTGFTLNEKQYSKIEQMNREIQFLTPIFTGDTLPSIVKSDSSDIRILTKEYQGKIYILVVNPTSVAQKVRLDISGLPISPESQANVLFENRKVKTNKNELSDQFNGFERHVYEIVKGQR